MFFMKKKLINPSLKEDAEITRAAKLDPDSIPLTNNEWKRIKKTIVRSSTFRSIRVS